MIMEQSVPEVVDPDNNSPRDQQTTEKPKVSLLMIIVFCLLSNALNAYTLSLAIESNVGSDELNCVDWTKPSDSYCREHTSDRHCISPYTLNGGGLKYYDCSTLLFIPNFPSTVYWWWDGYRMWNSSESSYTSCTRGTLIDSECRLVSAKCDGGDFNCHFDNCAWVKNTKIQHLPPVTFETWTCPDGQVYVNRDRLNILEVTPIGRYYLYYNDVYSNGHYWRYYNILLIFSIATLVLTIIESITKLRIRTISQVLFFRVHFTTNSLCLGMNSVAVALAYLWRDDLLDPFSLILIKGISVLIGLLEIISFYFVAEGSTFFLFRLMSSNFFYLVERDRHRHSNGDNNMVKVVSRPDKYSVLKRDETNYQGDVEMMSTGVCHPESKENNNSIVKHHHNLSL